MGESALENPMEADTIAGVKFDHFDLVAPYLAELRKRCYTRLASDKEYSYIREDIEQYKKLQADKTISLNEKQRLKQKEEDEARAKTRDKERLSRKPGPEIVHDLALKDVNLPGLPPPTPKTNSVAKASAARPAPSGDDMGDESAVEDEKPGAYDAALTEAEHILEDYLFLLPKEGLLTARVNSPK